jgi:hypothetical protein
MFTYLSHSAATANLRSSYFIAARIFSFTLLREIKELNFYLYPPLDASPSEVKEQLERLLAIASIGALPIAPPNLSFSVFLQIRFYFLFP